MIESVNLALVGHLNDQVTLAGVSLGHNVMIMLVLSTIMGTNSALETHVAHAYGKKQYRLCGEILNRTRFILFLMMIPLTLLLSQSEFIFLKMGQDPEVSLIASRYIMYMIPSFFIFGLFDAHRLMLNCMEETTIATSLVVIALPFHAVLGYYIVYKLGMGWVGVNISIFVTYVLLLIAMTVATVMMKNPEVQKAWVWPNRESFRDWWEITVLAVPGAFLYMVEWTACEGLVIFSGLIGVAELSAFGILMILMPTILCFTFGMQYAVTIYVGNSLGDGNHNKAYTQAKASFLMVACATVIVGTIVILGRSQMSMLFTEDAQVRSLFMIGLIFVIIETIPDSNQFVLQGIIKSLGKQDAAFAPVVFCQILIGMPTAYLLGVHYEYGIPGLLMGLGIGNTLLCGFYYRLAYGEDWYEVTRRVRQNLDGKLYLEN